MRRTLLFALIAASTACLYERQIVREPTVSVPPPPPGADSQPDSSYQAEAPPPPAGSEIADDAVFEQGLSPYGTWTLVAPYGRVWIPAVGYGWRPYYYGHWVLTDWGWTFASDDPWGWAAYHYGRWNWGVGFGWYWIPGRVWGPAWVSWRWGGGYAAWCPLGPNGVIFGYRHPAWVAVPEQHFTRPIRSVALPMRATAGVVNTTRPLAGAHATPGRGGSFGPPVAGVQRAVGRPIARVPAAQVVARPRAADSARPAARPLGGPGQSPRPAPRRYGGSPGSSGGQAGPRPRGGANNGAQGAPHSGATQSAPAPAAPKGEGHPHAGSKSK